MMHTSSWHGSTGAAYPDAIAAPAAILPTAAVAYPTEAEHWREIVSFLGLVNGERHHRRLPALQWHPSITWSAQWIAGHCAERSFLSHVDRFGRWPWDRVRIPSADIPPPHTWAGEVLAAGGAPGAAAAVAQWRRSPGHWRALMDARARRVGYSFVSSTGTPFDWPADRRTRWHAAVTMP
jgi:uncharacterized protein YkwD